MKDKVANEALSVIGSWENLVQRLVACLEFG